MLCGIVKATDESEGKGVHEIRITRAQRKKQRFGPAAFFFVYTSFHRSYVAVTVCELQATKENWQQDQQ